MKTKQVKKVKVNPELFNCIIDGLDQATWEVMVDKAVDKVDSRFDEIVEAAAHTLFDLMKGEKGYNSKEAQIRIDTLVRFFYDQQVKKEIDALYEKYITTNVKDFLTAKEVH